jgi:hypothetical protein
MCHMSGVGWEQLRLLLSKRFQLQHRPCGVHIQVQLRHLWYRQVRCGVSSRTQAHMFCDYLHARIYLHVRVCPAPANSLPNSLVSRYHTIPYVKCGVSSQTQPTSSGTYLHAGVCSAAANSLPNSLVSTVCAICQVWGEQLGLLLSKRVQVAKFRFTLRLALWGARPGAAHTSVV